MVDSSDTRVEGVDSDVDEDYPDVVSIKILKKYIHFEDDNCDRKMNRDANTR